MFALKSVPLISQRSSMRLTDMERDKERGGGGKR